MNGIMRNIVFGKDTRTSGLLALLIISLIAFGCTCGKTFDFGNIGSGDNSSGTRGPDSANTGGSDTNKSTADSENDWPFPGGTTDDDTKTDGSVPGASEMEALVQETTADFALAVGIENFTLIHAKASSDFQSSYTAEEMKNAFSTFVSQKSRVLPSLNNAATVTPKFSPQPHIRYDNNIAVLVADGEFPTKPYAVKFEYEYVFRDGEWKMLKLVIKM